MRYNSFKTRTKALAKQTGVKLSSLRETTAKALGFHDLHDLQQRLDQEGPQRELATAAEEIARCYRLGTAQVVACLDPASTTLAVSDPGQPLASFGLWDVYADCLEHRTSGYWINAERLLERTTHAPVEMLDWLFHMVDKPRDMRDGFDQAFKFALSHLLPTEQQPDNELLSRSLDYFNRHKVFRDAYEQEQVKLRAKLRAEGNDIANLGIMSLDDLIREEVTILAQLRARGIEEPQRYD